MKTAALFLAAAAMLLQSPGGFAATVSPSGYNNDFAVQPPAEDWATFSTTGNAQEGYEPDTDVNANITAAGVILQTTADAGNPALQMGPATWSSSGFYLQTRPTQNKYTALMGKFVNSTGTNATEIRLSYLFTIAAGGAAEEAGKGNRVYYSFSGLTESWINLTALNTTSAADGSVSVTTNVSLNWPDGGSLYLLWVDDNATGQATDGANQIDDFALHVTAGMPLSTALTARLTSPTNNAVFVSGESISVATRVTRGAGPYTVEYFMNGASIGSRNAAPCDLTIGNLTPGTYNLCAMATDSGVPAVSTNTS